MTEAQPASPSGGTSAREKILLVGAGAAVALFVVGGLFAAGLIGGDQSGGDASPSFRDEETSDSSTTDETTTTSSPAATTTTVGTPMGIGSIELVEQWEIGERIWTAEEGTGGIWIPRLGGLTRLDLTTGELREIELPGHPETPLAAFGSLWVPNISERTLHRFNLADLDEEPAVIAVGDRGFQPVEAAGRVWVSNRGDETLSIIDPADNSVVTVETGLIASMVSVNDEELWFRKGTQLFVVSTDGTMEELTAFAGSGSLWFAFDSVWMADATTRNMLRIDPATRTRSRAIDVGGGVGSLVASDDAIWMVTTHRVTRVDPLTSNVTGVVPIDGQATALTSSADGVWVATRGPCSAVHYISSDHLSLATLDIDGNADTALVVGDRVFVSLVGAVGTLLEVKGLESEVIPGSGRMPDVVAEARATVDGDTIVLGGTVPNEAAADHLQEVAVAAFGETNVTNELVIEQGAAPFHLELVGEMETPEEAQVVGRRFADVCASTFVDELEPKPEEG